MKYAFLILTLSISFSVFAQQEKPVQAPIIALKIPLQQAVPMEDVTLTFLEVVEDSRCPTNTTCIWEGRAVVKIELLFSDGSKEIKEIEFKNANTPVIGSVGDTTLQALRLSPYPDGDIPPAERAPYTLLVNRD